VAHVRRESSLRWAWAFDSLSGVVPRGGLPGCLAGCLDVTKKAAQLKREAQEAVKWEAAEAAAATAERDEVELHVTVT